MSALTDLFTAMANKIRSKTGIQTTYTPTEMVSDGIDDVYDAGFADATTSITPSNSSPVSMTANTGYKPTANGYAISSYNSVTPSDSSPISLSSGLLYKMGGNGKAVANVNSITPSNTSPALMMFDTIYKPSTTGCAIKHYEEISPHGYVIEEISNDQFYRVRANGYVMGAYNDITPSNATPVGLAMGGIYKINTNNGVAVYNCPSVTPSDSSPVSLSNGSVYKMGGAGYAIASYSTKTPSDSNPPSVASGDIVKMGGAGYLVKSVLDYGAPTYVKQGNMSSSGTMSQTTSSRAKLVVACRARYGDSTGQSVCMVWDEVNKRGYSLSYGSSYTNNAVDDTQDTIVVTDTNVTFKNKASSTQRGHLLIWC